MKHSFGGLKLAGCQFGSYRIICNTRIQYAKKRESQEAYTGAGISVGVYLRDPRKDISKWNFESWAIHR